MIFRSFAFAFAAVFGASLAAPGSLTACPMGAQDQRAEAPAVILAADDEELMMEGDDGTVGEDQMMEDEMMGDDEPGDDMMGDEAMESEDEAM